jgi:dGTPase
MRTEFQRDRDRIIHSKAFRRLKHKTQVFVAPLGDHYVTRLTHTLEVSQIARSIARALNLNEDLVEAISLGHDLGHTPFGHAGEEVLNDLCSKGFSHSEQSLRIVESLEKEGKGLNLTWEVREGILKHSKGRQDIQSYIFDGTSNSQRINTMVCDIIDQSWAATGLVEAETPMIAMSPELLEVANSLRQFLFQNVYEVQTAKVETERAKQVLRFLYQYFVDNPDKLPSEYFSGDDVERGVVDYIAGMTDNYALRLAGEHGILTFKR